MNNKTHAAGQLQGYLLQVRHMLFELISLEDIVVSVEKIEDVAIEYADGSIIAQQLKNVTADGNPVSDRSAVFWKTLYNWFNYVQDGSILLDKSIFRMVVVSNHNIGVGGIVEQFHRASTKEEALKALEAAKQNILGEDGGLSHTVSASYKQYLEVLFLSENEDLVAQIISKISIEVHENDYDEKLKKKFNAQTIPQEFADILFEYMLGWVNEKANEYFKRGLPAVVKSIDFRNALIAQSRMYSQLNSIPALSGEITSDEALAEVKSQDVYIQQLDLIEVDFDEKLEAASDYLRTKAETTLRAEKGLFTYQSSQDYHDKICRLWNNKRKQVLLLPLDSDIKQGKQLYAQASEAVLQITTSDNVFPSFFGSGSLQILANTPCEEPKIGWHPKYKELLKR